MTTTVDAHGWLVIASICDCGHVAITVMSLNSRMDTKPDGDHEITMTGPDWRPLVPEAARALHDRTGLRISGMCSAVFVRDRSQVEALLRELTSLVYEVGDAVAGAAS